MPHTYRFQVTTPFGPELPENVVSNTLHFRNTALASDAPFIGTDLDALCTDLANIFDGLYGPGTRRVTVKAYDTEGAPPHDPQSTVTLNSALALSAPNWPTQIACCLSFRGGLRPWERGRIYIAPWMVSGFTGVTQVSARPTDTLQTILLNLADSLSALGGANIDWVVRSATRHSDTAVNLAWVDDSWDIQRRRKTKALGRKTRAVSG